MIKQHNKKFTFLLPAVIAFMVVFSISKASAQTESTLTKARQILDSTSNYDLNSFIVKFKGDESITLIKVNDEYLLAENIQEKRRVEVNPDSARSEQEKRALLETKMAEYLSRDDVELVQPQHLYELSAWSRASDTDTPDDFDLTPSAATGNHWFFENENLRQLWQDQDCLNTGSECGGNATITVAVIDSGLAYENRTSAWGDIFAANSDMFGGSNISLYTNADETPNNLIDDDGNGFRDDYNGFNADDYVFCTPTEEDVCTAAEWAEEGHAYDDLGHGTLVTGLIASLTDNAAGTVGSAHNVTIMPVKVTNFHSGTIGTAEVVAGIDYAIDNGADIINMSFAGPADSLMQAKLDEASAAGIILIAATGNTNPSGGPVGYPAAYSNVIAVGAIDPDDSRSFYSNYGAEIDVVAYVGSGPNGEGDTVYGRSYTCYFSDNCDFTFNAFSNGYDIGTSFAAPQVTGLAAVLKSFGPGLTHAEIESLLETGATDVGTAGFDNDTGFGVINYEATYALLTGNTVPSITIVQPDGDDTADFSFNIVYTAADPDDDAVIDLYWDLDTTPGGAAAISGCTGLTESDGPDSCIFDTTHLPNGAYYIYACINDFRPQPVCVFSPGDLDINNTAFRDSGKLVAGTSFEQVSFTTSFTSTPVVFAEVSSEYGTDKVYVEIKNVDSSGFEVQLRENIASGWDNSHGAAEVSWYAVQTSSDNEQVGTLSLNTQSWVTVTFPVPFSSSPNVLAMPQSQTGIDMDYAKIRNVTVNGFEIRLEEPPVLDGAHGNETVGWIAFTDNSFLQEGTLAANHSWTTVNFGSPYSEPPGLVAMIGSYNGIDKANIDIRNVTTTGFEVRVEEDIRVQDGAHGNENIVWAAFPYTSPNSQSGSFTAGTNWTEVAFLQPFKQTPRLFLEVNTENGTDTVEADILQVSPVRFLVRIEEDLRAGWDGNHTSETIGWLALQATPSGVEIGTQVLGTSLATVNFSSPFSVTPVVFAEINSEAGIDTVALDIENVTTSGFDIKLEEDIGAGWDGGHTNETVVWMAFDPSSPPFSGQSATASVNHVWTPISFVSSFTVPPKVIADIQSEVGVQTINVDIRNITVNGFEMRVEEEPRRYDGSHTVEQVAWFAWE